MSCYGSCKNKSPATATCERIAEVEVEKLLIRYNDQDDNPLLSSTTTATGTTYSLSSPPQTHIDSMYERSKVTPAVDVDAFSKLKMHRKTKQKEKERERARSR